MAPASEPLEPARRTNESRQRASRTDKEDQTSFSKFTNSGSRAARLVCSETLSRSEAICAAPASCAPRRSRGARLLSRAVNYPKEKHLHPHRDDMTPCQWSRKLNLQMQNFLFPCRGLTPNARPTTTPKGGSLPTFFRPARLCLNVIISD